MTFADPSVPECSTANRGHPEGDGAAHPDGRRALDADSQAWVQGLTATGSARQATVARLYEMMLRVARREARRRSGSLQMSGPELDDVAHQAAADAVLAVCKKIEEFRGDSRFTTWAYKFAVFEVSTKMTRHAWRRPIEAMEAEDWDRLPARFGAGPDETSEWHGLIAALRRAVDENLTERQRRAFVAIVLNGVPLDVVVSEWGTNRNALYKALFDARRKLRAALVTNGHLDDNTLNDETLRPS